MKSIKFLLALLLVLATGIDITAAAAALSLAAGSKLATLGFLAGTFLPKFDPPNDRGGGGDSTTDDTDDDTRDAGGDGSAQGDPSLAQQIGEAVGRSVGPAVREAIVSPEVRQALFGEDFDPDGGRESAGRPNLGATRAGEDRDKKGKEGVYIQTARLVRGIMHRRGDMIEESVGNLIDMDQYRYLGITERAGYNTLTDADGGVFLPTVIAEEVLRHPVDVGAIRPNARIIPISSGKFKHPNITAGLVAFWVAEGTAAKARKAAFGSTTLDPEMLTVLVPWTLQMDDEAAGALMPIIIELLAEAFDVAIDDAGFNGDGTATYGGITGLKNLAGVGAFTAASGHTTPETLDWLDWLHLPYKVDYRARPFGSYVIHPDMEKHLLSLRDDNDHPIYRMPNDPQNGLSEPHLNGRPVEKSVKAPDPATIGTGDPFAFYGRLNHFLLGETREFQLETFDTGTIKDVDDTTDINLLTQLYKVMRATQSTDLQVGIPSSFAVGSLA